jgi:hypothetical protein
MSSYTSPVPMPGEAPAEIYREIYPMPMFVIAPTADLEASKAFWIDGLGFVDLFSVPGQITHLRRWAFQDVLLVPGTPEPGEAALKVSFSCVLAEIDPLAAACERLAPGSVEGPEEKPWNSIELTVTTPERTRVVMTAAQPLDPNSARAQILRDEGYDVPDA